MDQISLIETGNEANNGLLASFPTKSSGISAIFTRHPSRAKVSSAGSDGKKSIASKQSPLLIIKNFQY